MINSKTMSHMKENKVSVKLAAIDPLIVDNIVWPTEDKVRNKDFVSWVLIISILHIYGIFILM